MSEIGKALPWVAFWIFLAIYLWVDYRMYDKGHETLFFKHKTLEELRIREAVVRKLEKEAGIVSPPPSSN